LSLIGSGTFAEVLGCYDCSYHEPVAMKIIRGIPKYIDAAEIEIEILRDLRGRAKYAVELLDHFMYRGHPCLVMPKYGDSLYDFLKKNKYHGFEIGIIRSIGFRILESIASFKDMDLIHTDLKPENILFVNSDYDLIDGMRYPKYTNIRIIDFGNAVYEDDHHTEIIATRHYRPPEVLLNLKWSFPADVWAVGCILVEMIHGEAIFMPNGDHEHLAMIERCLGVIPVDLIHRTDIQEYFKEDKLIWPEKSTDRFSRHEVEKTLPLTDYCRTHRGRSNHAFFDLCSKMLEIDPSKRITAKEALTHDFFTDPFK
jgi:dual-specificity kinase